jgi:hypothetical protein
MQAPVLTGLIIYRSNSGAPEFARGFRGRENSFAALLSTVQHLARMTAGAAISHISLAATALTIVQSPQNGLAVAIFHDSTFYRCVARELAISVLRDYSERFNPNGITSFPIGALKLAMQSASRTVLRWLTTKLRGVILFAAIFSGNDIQETYPTSSDAVAVGATLDELKMALTELAQLVPDQPAELVVQSDQIMTRLVLYDFEGEQTTLLMQLRASANSPAVLTQLREGLDMLALCLRTSAKAFSLGESDGV